eukprot:TRINITY_DN6_c0_g1_i1.p1 TRINITY_DN6_c0_g1~~TRINITY_DN6_c0_g1_i1.p1  ORF type:complete len:273 (-),score=87.76 TRINITY_DN6_c0_g1_i1:100-918(-)
MSQAKVVVIFYSLYTHTFQLAQAIVAGAESVPGVKVELYQVPEILAPEIIEKMGATKAKEAMKEIPIISHEQQGEILKSADAIILGSPTRFGEPTSQLRSFLDGLGGMWYENALVGKIGSCFSGSGTQHGGQETTLFGIISSMLHLGLNIVGLPYSCNAQKESKEVSGGTPYGSTFIAGTDGSRAVSDNEKECARFQGKYVAILAKQFKAGREQVKETVSGDTTAPAKKPETNSEKKPEETEDKAGKKKKKAKKDKEEDGKKKKKGGKKKEK